MLCEECGKNQAEVMMTTVINGESTTRHLCRQCLKKYQAGDLQAVLAAVHAAGLEELVADKGLDADVGVGGSHLSGGEAQRVSIARAIVKKPEILILDEATANLDTKTEAAVTRAVTELMHGRTTLLIAHDYAAVEKADNVIVMRDGTVEDYGPRAEMIARNPFMKLMVEG